MQYKFDRQTSILSKRSLSKRFMNPDRILRDIEVKKGDVAADLGCGSGFFVIPASTIVDSGGKIYAVDILSSELEKIKGNAKTYGLWNIEYIQADLEVEKSTGIPSASVDIVIISNTLSQTQRDDKVIEEASRILKPKGKLVIIDWDKVKTSFGPRLEDRPEKDGIIRITEEIGLKFEQNLETGLYHYGLIFRK